MSKDILEKCNSNSSKADWRILEDKTIKYVDKETKIHMPLVCGYKDNYFNTKFHKKLIVNCDNLSDEDCSKDDNFCSFNGKCQFNEMNIPDKKAEIYNSNIVNSKGEMKKITKRDSQILKNFDPKNVMTGRDDSKYNISIVEKNCKELKSGIEKHNSKIFDTDYVFDELENMKAGVRHKLENHKYSCEKNIKYPEFSKSDFKNYNREYNDPENLHFVKRVNQDSQNDSDNSDRDNEGGKDIQGLMWDHKEHSSLLTDLQKNTKLRACIDEKLGIHKHEYYKNFIDKAQKQNFVIGDKELEFIKHAVNKFLSLRPEDIMECIEKLTYSDAVITKICKGDITLTIFETLGFVFEFIGIHIDFNDQSEKMVIELSDHIKPVLHKVITTSEYFEGKSCSGTSPITKNLKILYNSLFPTKYTPYAFFDYISKMFNGDWFKMFNDSIFGKIILLVFIAFIFSQMVKLFGNKCCETLQK